VVTEYTHFELDALHDPYENVNCGSEDLYYYLERAAERKAKRMLYPGRKYLYDVTLYLTRRAYNSGVDLDLLFLRWLRQASYVSTSFRYDLGKVLWHHTMISVGDENEEEFREERY